MEARLSALVLTLWFALLPACKGSGDQGKGAAPGAASGEAPATASAAPPATPTPAPEATAAPAPPPTTPGATAPTPSTGPFEGTIAMRITAGPKPLDLTFQTKGSKVRLDLTGADGKASHAIFDAAARKLAVLSDADKSMTSTVLPADTATAKVTKTGVHETILGRDCENWDVVEANGKHDAMCVTTGIPFVDFGAFTAPESGLPSFGEWMKGIADAKTFPLRQVVVGTSGAIEARIQVRVMEAHPVEDGVFSPPAGYKPAAAKH